MSTLAAPLTARIPIAPAPVAPLSPVARAALRGLTAQQRTLPPWLFYDAAGSELFERICRLPEYYLTRTEDAILREGADSVAALLS